MTQETSKAQVSTTNRFPLFAFFWAMAILFHVGKWNMWLLSPSSLALGFLTIAVLLRPNSIWLFIGLAGAQLFQVFGSLPWVPNHWFLVTFIHLVFFFAFCRLAAAEKTLHVNSERFYSLVAPVLRWIVILLYVVTLVHKLNRDWFDPSVSCGAVVYLDLVKVFPFLPSEVWAQTVSIYATLLLEALIPILLVWPRSRVAGILVGMALHYIFGAPGHFAFSAVMFALLMLFVPDNFRLPLILENFISSAPWRRARALAGWAVLLLAVIIIWKSPWRSHGAPAWTNIVWDFRHLKRGILSQLFEMCWRFYAPAVFIFLVVVIRRAKPVLCARAELFNLPDKTTVIFLLLFLFNAFSPYLGVKTGTSFSMFSNLRVTPQNSNHLFIPKGVDLFGYSGDLVKVLSSTDPELQEVADKGYLMPYFEFRFYISQKAALGEGNFRVNYVRGGEEKIVEKASDDPELSKRYPFYLRKLLYYRTVPTSEKCPCQH